MGRPVTFLYGLVCYVLFLFALLYAMGFVGDVAVPKSVDTGEESGLAESLVVNVLLLGLFAVQHTVMARPGFKRWWTKIVPVEAERSTFVLFASLALLLLYWQWRPLKAVIWSVENPAAGALLVALYWLGWFTVLFSTFIVDHFDLFGLRQVWYYLRGLEYHHIEFQTKSLYRYIRHPIMLGFIIAFWATPRMTAGHLLFTVVTTVYILIGIQFEEHDLKGFFGKDYEHYRRTVPMFIPFLRKRSAERTEEQRKQV